MGKGWESDKDREGEEGEGERGGMERREEGRDASHPRIQLLLDAVCNNMQQPFILVQDFLTFAAPSSATSIPVS